MTTPRIVVVGAGMGGLAAAVDLARRGAQVTVVERAAAPGGKMRRVDVGGAGVDGGPTVFTMRWIFESLFADAGERLEDALSLRSADVLARHAWRDGGRLDLHADIDRSADAIGAFAGARDAAAYRGFCHRSARVYGALRDSFIAAPRPTPLELVRRVGRSDPAALLHIAPLRTLWRELCARFRDPRLRQLFGRYATYVGSSPFGAPATLMLIAHVEQDGVWFVEGGMHAVARALEATAGRLGATFRYGTAVERIDVRDGVAHGVTLAGGERLPADAVLFNGDANALAAGLLGSDARGAAPSVDRAARSLSAITWCLHARTAGFPLSHHNVFFGDDYADEFDAVFRRRTVCASPTVYVCAQDRGTGAVPPGAAERLLLLVNAPADGDRPGAFAADFVGAVRDRTFRLVEDCGLVIEPGQGVTTTPAGFERLFPGTGGALYGRANHGAFASFARPGSASRIGRLYMAGGSVHPGAGVPMATMSGRLAAARLLEDLAAGR